MHHHPETELQTVEQFAHRMQVSRATVFVWLRLGILKNGCHYFKIGRVLRFVWSEDLIKQLLECSVEDLQEITPVKLLPQQIHQKKHSLINLDY